MKRAGAKCLGRTKDRCQFMFSIVRRCAASRRKLSRRSQQADPRYRWCGCLCGALERDTMQGYDDFWVPIPGSTAKRVRQSSPRGAKRLPGFALTGRHAASYCVFARHAGPCRCPSSPRYSHRRAEPPRHSRSGYDCRAPRLRKSSTSTGPCWMFSDRIDFARTAARCFSCQRRHRFHHLGARATMGCSSCRKRSCADPGLCRAPVYVVPPGTTSFSPTSTTRPYQ